MLCHVARMLAIRVEDAGPSLNGCSGAKPLVGHFASVEGRLRIEWVLGFMN